MLNELLEHKKIADSIESYGLWSTDPGIELFSEMLERIDHPETGLKFVHVAGTNGKGSSVFFIGQILSALGYKVGSYTSPHFDDPTERVTIDGKAIDFREFDEFAKKVLDLASKPPEYLPTSSDIYLAIALMYFAEMCCDYVILETGLGGRLDSTNAVFKNHKAEVSLITRIGLDHTAILGDTIQEVAAEKAGIIRSGSDVVIGTMDQIACDCITDRCAECGADYTLVSEDKNLMTTVAAFFPEYKGSYQQENIANAIAVVRRLGFSEKEIIKVFDYIDRTGPIGRLLIKKARAGQPAILIDGAHNPCGIKALCRYIEDRGITKAVGVCGIKRDKDASAMLELMVPYLEEIHITSVGEGRRRTDIDRLDEVCKGFGLTTHIRHYAEDAFDSACESAFRKKIPVICFGSLELAAEAAKIIED